MIKSLFGFPVVEADIPEARGEDIKLGDLSEMNRILNNAEWQRPISFFVIVDGKMYEVRMPDEKEQQE